METVEETRRAGLRLLVSMYGSMANLCEKLGYARNETATLTRILNANVRRDRGGKPYNMGRPLARHIEDTLKLGTGWMDTQNRTIPLQPSSPDVVIAGESTPAYTTQTPSRPSAVEELRNLLKRHSATRRKTCADLLSRMAVAPEDDEIAFELETLLSPPTDKANERMRA